MSSRAKRKFDFDPNASDPDDLDYDVAERPSPQKRRHHRGSSQAKSRGSKRHRRGYRGSDVDDDDDEIVTDDSFTDRSSDEEPEINPETGRAVRRATKKEIKYEESEEDDIEDISSEEDELAISPQKRRRQPERQSLIVKLKMPGNASSRALRDRTRTGSKSVQQRGKTPEASGARRSSRLSHDVETPIVELSESGKHVNIIREGTRSPEPVIARATKGGKGPSKTEHPSIIMEASQEASMLRDDSPGPLDNLLGDDETQVQASNEDPQEHEAQESKEEDDDEMEGVIQESQHEGAPEESDDDDEEGPITRGGRNLRSRAKSAKRKRGVDESSDFEPAAEEEKEDEEMSASEHGKGLRYTSEESGSGSGRRSARVRASRRQRSRRNSGSSDGDSALDADELAEEAQELAATKRRRLNRNLPDKDLAYDTAPKLRNRARATVDYRVIRPEQNTLFDDDEAAMVNKSRPRGGRSGYRSLFSNQGPFGGGLEAGPGAVGGIDSDSSDDEAVQRAPRGVGGAVGMTPTTATGPGFGFPQTHNADPQQAAASGGGPANFGKVKDKKALADADPLGVNPNVNFSEVGGLDDHIGKLKEMVLLPLLYPEVFQQFHITPPRGVLFHGPPGTGKTLLARALASSVSESGQKVTFYMRKGADALSKWVGEAERQLRLLFEEARKTQPSIIFFDEIDGLAPVRSSKQEQIHASIVATLLALMDGMDGRGQVIVIGATNRPDSVDNALRRPGRFDREFYFPLPNVAGRRSIIDIHTKNWEPPLKPVVKDQLAELTKGYGGADLRALCTEAALNAVQGTYPQIYKSERKLLINPSTIKVLAKDFMISVNKIVPSSQRTVSAKAAPLSKTIEPLLRKPLEGIMKVLDELIPRRKVLTALEEAEYDDRDDEKGFERDATLREFESGRIFRPRLLINGLQGMGQQYLGAALLNKIEGLHVQSFDLPTIFEDATRSPEAAITQLFTEVRRHKPSVIYIPAVDVWYQTLPGTAIKTFKLLLRGIGANEPILLLGVMEQDDENQKPDPQMMADLFSFSKNNQFMLPRPDKEARAEFFNNISHYIRMSPADFPDPDKRKKRVIPELEPAPQIEPTVDPRELVTREKAQKKQDRLVLNKLKILIQPVMDQLKRSFRKFHRPIIDESAYMYLLYEDDPNHFRTDLPPEQQQEQGIIRPFERTTDSRGIGQLVHVESGNKYYNLDLVNIEKRLSNGYYKRPKDFLFDIKTLAKDARVFGEEERILKTKEMETNVEVDMDMIENGHPALIQECDAVYARELQRARKAQEKRAEDIAAGKDVGPNIVNVPPDISTETGEASGPIILGEPVPGRPPVPPVTPIRSSASAEHPASAEHLSNGVGTHGTSSVEQQNGSEVSRHDEDSHMTDSQDLNTQKDFQTPSRLGTQTQTQKSQVSAHTFMDPNSLPRDYHNSASTTTSGRKTSDRSSGAKGNTQSTNGITPGLPEFSTMIPPAGDSQDFPNTQEQNYAATQAPNSQPSPVSQTMPAPPPPRSSIMDIDVMVNDEVEKPKLIVDETLLLRLHEQFVDKTSGLSVEQLEQVNAAIMDAIWKGRSEYNRVTVVESVATAFNEIIDDIQAMQKMLNPSQPDSLPQPTQYRVDTYGYESQQPRRFDEGSQMPREWGFARPIQG